MNTYLVHLDFAGSPIGIWNDAEESYYPQANALQRSAETLMASRIDGESWEDFSDRLSSRVSHRDWWEVFSSSGESLEEVWHEVKPSDAPIF